MDASRFKRRSTQTLRQTANYPPGSTVDGLGVVRPRTSNPVSSTPVNPVQPVAAKPQPAAPVEQPLFKNNLGTMAVKTVAQTPKPKRLPPIDMGLPGQPSEWQSQTVLKHSIWRHLRHWAFRAVIVVLIALIGIGGLLFSQGFLKLHKVFRGGTATAAALKANVDPTALKSEGDGRVNILLLGRGGGNHDGPDLTDTMMLASIDPVNHTEVLVSIPRDLWVKVNGGATKINAAWETGEFNYEGKIAPGSTDPKAISAGFKQVDQTVSGVLGVNIDYNVLVDFQAFQQAVDSIGGVTVNVPTDLYDPTMAWENGGNPILAKAGVQQFDGKHALIYVRSRETTSDFARAQRQRAVLLALKSKVETLGTLSNPLKIADLMNAFGNNVATDLSLSDATKLYSVVKGIGDSATTSTSFADAPNDYVTTGMVGNQSTVQPKAGMFDYTDIQTFIRSQLKDGYLVKENAKVLVLNGTTTPGVATNTSNLLKSYGYNVIGAANAPTSGWTQTSVIDLTNGKDPYTRHYLEQRFNVTAQTKLPDSTIQTNGADFVIIVGSDEATSQ